MTQNKAKNLILNIKLFVKNVFWENKIMRGVFLASVLVNLVNWTILKIWIVPVDLPIILHYNVYFGVDNLGDWKQVYISPILGMFFLLTNGFLGAYSYRHQEIIASYLFFLGGFMAQLCLLIYSASLVIINY